MKIYTDVMQVIAFTFNGYVYQWNYKTGVFTPNGKIPDGYPIGFLEVPDEAKQIMCCKVVKGVNDNGKD